MVCSIISDMETSPRIEARLRFEIDALTDMYAQVDFLVGDSSGVERQAREIINSFKYKSYFINCHRVSTDAANRHNTLVPDGLEMVKPECVMAWRNRWMLKRSELAIICMADRAALPPPEDIPRMKMTDISR